MRHLKKFNEEITQEEIDDTSETLASLWISCEDFLPNDKQIVLIYSPTSQLGKIKICEFLKGISKEERKALPAESQRKRMIKPGDEWDNNKKPYVFKVPQSPGQYFGQEVTHWMPIPKGPNY